MGREVVVFRYGHRIVRDFRVTSHCCLVARAFGAEKIIIQGVEDELILKTINRITRQWGGNFEAEFTDSWRNAFREYKDRGFKVVHMTMYGLPIEEQISKIRAEEKILLVLGSQKVEKAVYDAADYNIAITSQPHSEIAALAVFLDRYFDGCEFKKEFAGCRLKITPQGRGKKVIASK